MKISNFSLISNWVLIFSFWFKLKRKRITRKPVTWEHITARRLYLDEQAHDSEDETDEDEDDEATLSDMEFIDDSEA